MIEGSEGSEQQKGMMGRARQLWSVVGKVRTAHAAACCVKGWPQRLHQPPHSAPISNWLQFAGFEGSRKRLGTADGERSFGHQGGPRLPLGKSR